MTVCANAQTLAARRQWNAQQGHSIKTRGGGKAAHRPQRLCMAWSDGAEATQSLARQWQGTAKRGRGTAWRRHASRGHSSDSTAWRGSGKAVHGNGKASRGNTAHQRHGSGRAKHRHERRRQCIDCLARQRRGQAPHGPAGAQQNRAPQGGGLARHSTGKRWQGLARRRQCRARRWHSGAVQRQCVGALGQQGQGGALRGHGMGWLPSATARHGPAKLWKRDVTQWRCNATPTFAAARQCLAQARRGQAKATRCNGIARPIVAMAR